MRRLILSIAVLASAGFDGPAAAAPGGTADGVPAKELASEAYEVVTDPENLPGAVQAAWAVELRQKQLDVAAAGASYNSSDVGWGTRHRLVLAAVSPKYAVVYFESGGIGVRRRVFVFSRAVDPATFVWGGRPQDRYQEPKAFLAALRSGTLWRERQRTP